MEVTRCKTDAGFEQQALKIRASLDSELGYQQSPAKGYFPIDWKAVKAGAQELKELAEIAATHGRDCAQCQRDEKHGYSG